MVGTVISSSHVRIYRAISTELLNHETGKPFYTLKPESSFRAKKKTKKKTLFQNLEICLNMQLSSKKASCGTA